MTLTKEQIEMYASAADATQTFEMDKGKLIAVEPEHMQELARIALAALESRADAEPVSGTQFRAVADLYSIAVPGGRSVTYSTDAAEASDFRAMGWAVQEYVKLERLQDAYLRPQPAPVVQDCQKCGGTGMADSGGVQPWGEPIEIPCDCSSGMLQGGK